MCYDTVTFSEQPHGSDIYLLSELDESVYLYYSNYKNDFFLFFPLHISIHFHTWKQGKLRGKKSSLYYIYMRNKVTFFKIQDLHFYDLVFLQLSLCISSYFHYPEYLFPHGFKLNKRFSHLLTKIPKSCFLGFN